MVPWFADHILKNVGSFSFLPSVSNYQLLTTMLGEPQHDLARFCNGCIKIVHLVMVGNEHHLSNSTNQGTNQGKTNGDC